MVLRGLRISLGDQALLDTRFSVGHPAELGEMVHRIEPGTKILGVQATYHVRAGDDDRDAWVRCCACCKSHNHKRGFVVLLPDGKRATVGRDCGENKHELEYRDQLSGFDARVTRQRTLRHILDAYSRHPVLMAQIDALQQNAGVRALAELRSSFAQRFPALCTELMKAQDGRLISKVRVRDAEAERARRNRLERKLTDLAKHRKVSRDEPAIDRQLLAELVASNDPDASKDRIMTTELRALDSYRGVAFVTKLSRLHDRLADLRRRALHCLNEFEGRESETLDNDRLREGLQSFTRVVRDVLRLHQEIRDALGFLDPANITGIIRYVNRIRARSERLGSFTFDGGVFKEVVRGTMLDFRIPVPTLSGATLSEVYYEVTGDRIALHEAA
jgi:hypothetical protein